MYNVMFGPSLISLVWLSGSHRLHEQIVTNVLSVTVQTFKAIIGLNMGGWSEEIPEEEVFELKSGP